MLKGKFWRSTNPSGLTKRDGHMDLGGTEKISPDSSLMLKNCTLLEVPLPIRVPDSEAHSILLLARYHPTAVLEVSFPIEYDSCSLYLNIKTKRHGTVAT